ncbi:polysaccharide pyruvyl transferase family protein [Hallella faecis]|uniref:polysaccharide pyruvyl transferase family protein n=1 Tax=Hallella faecis TaxID=2841596 RepID=UPI003F8C19B9
MRIGILTLPLHTNYGGILQAYALQTVLERMGHEVVIFDCPLRKFKLPIWKKPLCYSKRIIKRYILQNKSTLINKEKIDFEKERYFRKNTQTFINAHIHRNAVRKLEDIKEDDIDAIVVGSDQIWRMLYFKSMWFTKRAANAFLAFTAGWNIKRIAYAASFGNNNPEISEGEIEDCRKAISLFNAVSVREKSGVKICKELFGINAQWVLDPTMLLSSADYTKLIDGKIGKSTTTGALMSYVLDENSDVSELRATIAKEKNLRINITNVAVNGIEQNNLIAQPPVENWLHSFLDADFVINDSFHACVFSILFHKQFIVFGNKERGMERFTSLLGMFGLEDRLVTSSSEYKPQPDIDYTKVDKILKEKRQEAMSFLESSLK